MTFLFLLIISSTILIADNFTERDKITELEFDNDRYTIRSKNYIKLDTIYQTFIKKENAKLEFVGYTTEEVSAYGYRLSYKRAKQIKDYMIDNYKIETDKIEIFYDLDSTKSCRCVESYIVY